MDGGGGCATMRMHLTPPNYVLKMGKMVNIMVGVFYYGKKK